MKIFGNRNFCPTWAEVEGSRVMKKVRSNHMCTKEQALEITGKVYERYNELMPIKDIWLYGSYARGDQHKWSDVDIFVVADTDINVINNRIAETSHIDSDLSLQYDVTVSVTVKPRKQFEKYVAVLPYYQNVVSEGIKYGK